MWKVDKKKVNMYTMSVTDVSCLFYSQGTII